jgi:hypothetical protein
MFDSEPRNHNPRVGGFESLLRYQQNQGLSSKVFKTSADASNRLATMRNFVSAVRTSTGAERDCVRLVLHVITLLF